jgi:hypothetical protein
VTYPFAKQALLRKELGNWSRPTFERPRPPEAIHGTNLGPVQPRDPPLRSRRWFPAESHVGLPEAQIQPRRMPGELSSGGRDLRWREKESGFIRERGRGDRRLRSVSWRMSRGNGSHQVQAILQQGRELSSGGASSSSRTTAGCVSRNSATSLGRSSRTALATKPIRSDPIAPALARQVKADGELAEAAIR